MFESKLVVRDAAPKGVADKWAAVGSIALRQAIPIEIRADTKREPLVSGARARINEVPYFDTEIPILVIESFDRLIQPPLFRERRLKLGYQYI